ncbi:MAG: DUF2142 domain-containing protein [Oscillospiraceae bacterium]|nr:DUF2142 domain-containing protein [Oscillospiraceae bacterium]
MKSKQTAQWLREARQGVLRSFWQRAAALALTLFFLTVILHSFSAPRVLLKTDPLTTTWETEYYAVVLGENDTLTQPFRLSRQIRQMSLYMATYTETVTDGQVHIQILDASSGEILAENSWGKEQLLDLTTLTTRAELPAGSYVLWLQTQGITGASVALLSRETGETGEMCLVNGAPQPWRVSFVGEYYGTQIPFPLMAAVGALLMTGAFVLLHRRASLRIVLWAAAVAAAAALLLKPISDGAAGLRRGIFLAGAALIWLGGPLLFARRQLAEAVRRALAGLRRGWRVPCSAGLGAGIGAFAEHFYAARLGQPFLWGRGLAFMALAFLLALFTLSWRKLLRSPEKCFAVAALTLGLYLAVAMPAVTGVSWDDQIHYSRTVHLSQNIYSVYSNAENGLEALTFPISFSQSQTQATDMAIADLYENGSNTLKYSRASILPDRYGYLPMAAGHWLGKILSLPYPGIFVLGRVCNVFVYVLVMTLAMRKLRYGKMALFAVGLLTTNLFQAASYSYDAWVTSFLTMGFAVYFSELQTPEKLLSGRDAAWMIGSIVVGCLPKDLYCIVLPALLLMPKEKFPDRAARKRYCLWVLGTLAVMLAYCALPQLIDALRHNGGGDLRGGSDVNLLGQVKYILSDIPRYLGVLARFLRWYLAPDTAYAYTSFFAYVGAVTTGGWLLAPVLASALLDRGKDERCLLDRRPHFRLAGLAVLLAQVCAVVTVLYLVFTPVGSDSVAGCQPRYLLPLVFPAFMLAFHWGVRSRLPAEWKTAVLGLASMAGPVYVIWTLLTARFVP